MEFIDINANLTGVSGSSVATGDFDGDGDLDLLITGYDSSFNGISKIYENDGSGGFSEDTAANLTGVFIGSVATGDYDEDGDLDLLITGRDSSNNRIAKIYENDGSGGFSEDTAANLTGVDRTSVATGDYDGDGDLDLLIAGQDSSYNTITKLYENDGSGGFNEDTSANFTFNRVHSVTWGDYDGDSDLDLLITGLDSSFNTLTKLYENDGSGGLSENTSANLTDVAAGLTATGDYDGDGDLDLLITSRDSFSPLTKLYENNGSGSFSEDTSANLTDVAAGSVAIEDYDGDGDLDLLVTGYNNGNRTAKIYENDGSGGFSEDTSANLEGVWSSSVATGDYDGDNDLDLLITGRDSSNNSIAKIYQNNSVPVFDNSGRDNLDGTDAAEILDGGDGNDTLNGSLGADDLIGGEGRDRAIYRNSAAAVTVDLSTNTATGGDAEGDTFDSIESVDGSNFDDALTGDDNENRLYGRNGDDTLIDNAGDDYLSGQGGADSLAAGAGLDRLLGGSGNDTLAGEADSDILAGGVGDDSLTGASLETNGIGEIDRMQGNAGADIFVLGTDTTAFYDDGENTTKGMGDYALIFDFDATEDVIELSSTETYYLGENPVGTVSGTGVFMESDGTEGFSSDDELVGLLKDVSLTAGLIDGSTAGFDLV